MFKGFIVVLAIALSSTAYASSYSLKDPAILGKYVLNQVNKLSSIQTAEIRYDADEKLTLFISHTGDSIPIEEIADDGLINAAGGVDKCEGEDCAEGDTANPMDIRLIKGDKGQPQLVIELTWADTTDEDDKNGETVSYVLDWTNSIPNAISFYTNMEAPAALQGAIDSCLEVVAPAASDNGPISSEYETCPSVNVYKYRSTIEEAMPWFLKESRLVRGTKEVPFAEMQSALTDEEEYLAGLPSKGLKVKPSKIAAAFRKEADHLIKNADRAYAHENDGSVSYYAINTKNHTITTFDLTKRR